MPSCAVMLAAARMKEALTQHSPRDRDGCALCSREAVEVVPLEGCKTPFKVRCLTALQLDLVYDAIMFVEMHAQLVG